jgi:hypothetical protein
VERCTRRRASEHQARGFGLALYNFPMSEKLPTELKYCCFCGGYLNTAPEVSDAEVDSRACTTCVLVFAANQKGEGRIAYAKYKPYFSFSK